MSLKYSTGFNVHMKQGVKIKIKTTALYLIPLN